jgi:GTP-binding protein
MNIKSVSFRGSFKSYTQCPADNLPEFAFIGRSNVGKSSLINMLLKRKDMVRVSNKPGKTQSLNYFLINDQFYLVDLPGYGYARVSKTERQQWEKMIAEYFQQRKSLACVYQLIDIRLEPQAADIAFTNQLGEWQIPFQLIFTKSDKVSRNDALRNVQLYFQVLRRTWDVLPHHTITSAEKYVGRDALLDTISLTLEETRQ